MSERPSLFVRATLVAKGLTPPFLWAALKAAKRKVRSAPAPEAAQALDATPSAPEPAEVSEWEYVPEGWARPAGGWDVETIASVYREKWPSFLAAVEGTGPLGVNHEVAPGRPVPRDDLEAQQMVLAFGYALARAAHRKASVSLLDWGGGPGHFAVLGRALLPDVELEYHSRDLPALAALGRELLPADSFYSDDSCLDRTYDLVVASSSLHYSQDWRSTLAGLARAVAGHLYVTRVPISAVAPSFVMLQRAQHYGYGTEYLGWVLNRDELLEEASSAGLVLEREVVLPVWLSGCGCTGRSHWAPRVSLLASQVTRLRGRFT